MNIIGITCFCLMVTYSEFGYSVKLEQFTKYTSTYHIHDRSMESIIERKSDEFTKYFGQVLSNIKFPKPKSAAAVEIENHKTSYKVSRNKNQSNKKQTFNQEIKSKKTFMDRFRFMKGGSNDKKRVLILMSDTGGGHRASARALDQAINDLYPGKIDVNIMDIWTDYGKWPFNRFVPVYRFLAKHPPLWRGFYLYGAFPPTRAFTEFMSWHSCYKSFKQAIEEADPDFVVSVHPLTQLMPISIVNEMNKKRSPEKLPIPFVTIVTDLGGAHSTWFDNRVDACFVPSEAVRKIAIKNGIDEEKLLMRGLPIRPSFWKPSKSKVTLRSDLGLSKQLKTVLLMGGGDGVGGLANIASEMKKKLDNLNQSSQMIVICGHNKKVSDWLSSQLVQANSHTKVVVKGFVDNIDEFMAASDCLVTKAGPGTIAESMIRGLPLVLSSYLPGQEYGNVPYVVDGGFGVYTGNRPRKIAATVSTLFTNEELLKNMSKRAKEHSHPEATRAIAKDIGEFVLRKTPNIRIHDDHNIGNAHSHGC